MNTYYNSTSFVNTVAAYFVNDYSFPYLFPLKGFPGIKARFLTASEMYHKEVKVKDHCAFNMDLFLQKPISIDDDSLQLCYARSKYHCSTYLASVSVLDYTSGNISPLDARPYPVYGIISPLYTQIAFIVIAMIVLGLLVWCVTGTSQ